MPITSEATTRQPVLDEQRWAIVCTRLDRSTHEYDPRATRTTIEMLDEDVSEDIAVEMCGVAASETDVVKVYLVKITFDDEFVGSAAASVGLVGLAGAEQGDEQKVQQQRTNEPPTPQYEKPSTPLTNVTEQHNRGLRLKNPKEEAWRRG